MAEKLSPELSEGAETEVGNSQKGGPAAWNAKPSEVLGSTFLLDKRYEITAPMCRVEGQIVAAALDTVTGFQVAIRKIETGMDNPVLLKRKLRELRLLRLIQHENIVPITTIQLPANKQELEEIYVVSVLMDANLSQVLKSKQELSEEHCQFFVYQTLKGLKVLHGLGVLHRELKPSTLIINSNCDLKIRDFTLARVDLLDSKAEIPDPDHTLTIGTWYRAPEFLLGDKKYTKAMEMWSIGCILGELLSRKPILPGTGAENQLELIFELLGTPSDEDIHAFPSSGHPSLFDRLPKKDPKDLSQIFLGANPLALDLLAKLLQLNPAKRLTAEEALRHPYLSRYHIEDDKPSRPPLSAFDFLFEAEILSAAEVRELIYEEILLYHFQGKAEEYENKKATFEAEKRAKEPPATPTISESSTGSEHGEI